MNNADPTLLFDLGGVLVEWDGIRPLIDLAGQRLQPEQARKFWLESPSVREFERGRCSPRQFAEGVISELGLRVKPDDFIREFTSWDRGPLDGAIPLLERLHAKYPLACLTNNNELHWPRLRDEFGFGKYFRHTFVSHELGLMKPDREVFELVVERLGLPGQRVYFFDDNPECVESARSVGLRAFVTRGVEALEQTLLREQILI